MNNQLTRPSLVVEVYQRPMVHMLKKAVPDEAGIITSQQFDVTTIRVCVIRRPGKIDMNTGIPGFEVIEKCLQPTDTQIVIIDRTVVNHEVDRSFLQRIGRAVN